MKKIYYFFCLNLLGFQIVFAQPVINSINPLTGPVGSTVVISGTGFNATASLNTVYFGATSALVNNASTSNLTVTVPFGANNFPVSVLNNANNLIAYSTAPFQTTFLCPATITNTSLAPKIDFPVGINPFDVEIADLDGDGKSDIIAAIASSGSGSICARRNTSGTGTITNTSFAANQFFVLPEPVDMAIADINEDGKLDIVTCSYSSHNFSVLKNISTPGSISFDPPVTFFFSGGTSGPNGLAIADLDFDGKTDVVIAAFNSGKIAVFKNTSSVSLLTFAANVDFISSAAVSMPAIADFDGDGKKDIAAINNSVVTVFKNTSSQGIINLGSFAPAVSFTCPTILQGGIAVGDLDSDGKTDLVATSLITNDIYIFRNTATTSTITSASFAAPVTYTSAGSSVNLSIGELNGDNKPEILIPIYGGVAVSLFQNNSTSGSINFSPKVDFVSGGSFGRAIVLGDVDNDGKNDMLSTSLGGGFVSVFRNLGGLNTSISTTSVSCNSGSNGQIQLTTTSINTIAIIWSNSATTFTINNLVAGVYNYTLTSGTCVLSQSVNVQQPAPINLTASSTNSIICEGQTTTLTANGATTYSWSQGVASASVVISPSVTTTYIVTGTLNGCASSITISQLVSTFTLNASSNNTLLCVGETATLNASGAITYAWIGIGSGSGVAVNPSVTTTYTLNGLNVDGCSKTTTLTLEVSECTGNRRIKMEDFSFKVHPNPYAEMFYLELSNFDAVLELEIYNSIGQCVLKRNLEGSSTTINLKNEPKGIYFIKLVSTDKVIAYRKIIKSE